MEKWRECEDWPDYLVSNSGKVWSRLRDRELKISLDTKGYPTVNLQRDGKWRRVAVHRLVALAFVDGYFAGAFVNHIDGNKSNNHENNLEWVTRDENMAHAREIGMIKGRKLRFWSSDEPL